LQWILDRGGWQLSHLNKAFEYLFNSTTEDQKVAKYLSGWQPDDAVWTPSLEMLDTGVQHAVQLFRFNVFHLDTTPDVEEFRFRDDVINLLTAVLIFNYPEMTKLQPRSLFQRRVVAALHATGNTETDLTAWSLALRHARMYSKKPKAVSPHVQSIVDTDEKGIKTMLQEHVDVMTEMMNLHAKQHAALTDRIAALESNLRGVMPPIPIARQVADTPRHSDAHAHTTSALRARSAPQSPTDVWYHWYIESPPLWENRNPGNRQRFYDTRMLIAYMRLFLPEDYCLCRGDIDYTSEVIRLGELAHKAVMQYLRARGSRASSVGTLVKVLKHFDNMGAFDGRRSSFVARVRDGSISDPSSVEHLVPWKHQ
jgi:hypothetical protein